MTDVYLAAPYSARAEVRGNAQMLIALGWSVSATWAFGVFEGLPLAVAARQDLEEIAQARCLVADFTAGPSTTGGMHVEIGYALARGIPVVCVGERPERAALMHHEALHWVHGWRSDALQKALRVACRGECPDA